MNRPGSSRKRSTKPVKGSRNTFPCPKKNWPRQTRRQSGSCRRILVAKGVASGFWKSCWRGQKGFVPFASLPQRPSGLTASVRRHLHTVDKVTGQKPVTPTRIKEIVEEVGEKTGIPVTLWEEPETLPAG